MLLDWLVTGHVIDVNPAHAVRGPKYVVKKGKTPVLTADDARTLLDSIPIVKAAAEDGAAAAARSMTFPVNHNLWSLPGRIYCCGRYRRRCRRLSVSNESTQVSVLTEKPMHQQDAYRMIQRRAKAAGIETKIGNHTFRATDITAYLKDSGKLEVAQPYRQSWIHESTWTTKLYDRRRDGSPLPFFGFAAPAQQPKNAGAVSYTPQPKSGGLERFSSFAE
jgi:integrase